MSIKIQIDNEEIILNATESKKFVSELELENQKEKERLDLIESKKNEITNKLGLTAEELKTILG